MKKEFIICSAIHYDDGKIYDHQPININKGIVICGRRHHNCFHTVSYIFKNSYRLRCKEIQGFLTNENRFINRIEAMEIAKKANQLLEPNINSETLTSEDLW